MSRKPYASDWEVIDYSGLQYSKALNLWYKDGTVYDERSANHNGIIGAGATLKQAIKEANDE